MVAQNNFRAANADMFIGAAAAELFLDAFELLKERPDKSEELLAGRRQLEGASLEEGYPQVLFQLNDLTAHGRLLDAIRHVAHALADPAVAGHMIKQFQVMNIHELMDSMTVARLSITIPSLPSLPSRPQELA